MREDNINTVGTVIKTDGKRATVAFKRTKACGDCHACVSFGGESAEVELENTLGAAEGDRVEIALHSGSVIKASLILYGLPLAALLAGVLIGSRISDLAAALIGIGAAGAALIAIRLMEPKFKRLNGFDPRMTALVNTNNTGASNGEI